MTQKTRYDVASMPRASALENGTVLELEFLTEHAGSAVLCFDALKFETMLPRILDMVAQAQKSRRAKPLHS